MSIDKAKALIAGIGKKKLDMYHKDFLLTWEKSLDELEATFDTAKAIKLLRDANVSSRL